LRIRVPSNLTPKQAIALQKKWAPLVTEESDLPSKLETLVGCDATYFHGITVAAAAMIDLESLRLLKMKTVAERTRFPYIPGLLAFREAPSILRAIRSLRTDSYVCLVDAHGLAHPRRFGLACFVGIALDRPTIGVAKSLLYGAVRGDRVVDRDGDVIAEAVTLPGHGKTIYVSVGHKVSLEDAVKVVKGCLTHRGPAPIIMAHDEVTRLKCQLKKSNPVCS
jgi:deoxyribonuclease V